MILCILLPDSIRGSFMTVFWWLLFVESMNDGTSNFSTWQKNYYKTKIVAFDNATNFDFIHFSVTFEGTIFSSFQSESQSNCRQAWKLDLQLLKVIQLSMQNKRCVFWHSGQFHSYSFFCQTLLKFHYQQFSIQGIKSKNLSKWRCQKNDYETKIVAFDIVINFDFLHFSVRFCF